MIKNLWHNDNSIMNSYFTFGYPSNNNLVSLYLSSSNAFG